MPPLGNTNNEVRGNNVPGVVWSKEMMGLNKAMGNGGGILVN